MTADLFLLGVRYCALLGLVWVAVKSFRIWIGRD